MASNNLTRIIVDSDGDATASRKRKRIRPSSLHAFCSFTFFSALLSTVLPMGGAAAALARSAELN
jgi:hypothetical protein